MCLLLYYLNPHARDDEFYLVLVNVRDEVYDRPSQYAHFWPRNPDVIGGIVSFYYIWYLMFLY